MSETGRAKRQVPLLPAASLGDAATGVAADPVRAVPGLEGVDEGQGKRLIKSVVRGLFVQFGSTRRLAASLRRFHPQRAGFLHQAPARSSPEYASVAARLDRLGVELSPAFAVAT